MLRRGPAGGPGGAEGDRLWRTPLCPPAARLLTWPSVATDAATLSVPDRAGHEQGKLAAYVALTKPRIIELLLVTTVPSMVVAAGGWPSTRALAATLAGGALSAGGANAANMVFDRDIDAVMHRTSGRPVVTGAVSPLAAAVFAATMEAAAFVTLLLAVNALAAVLALSAALFYVFVYTAFLKRLSPQNIVIGGAAGAAPVLVGWAAVRGSLGWAPLLLAGLVFLWTPPHFWSLAIRYRDDYRRAGVPMMPVVRSAGATSWQVFGYAVATVVCAGGFAVLAGMGWLYWAASAGAGTAWLALCGRLVKKPTAGTAMAVFHWSITYLSVVFVAIAVDVLAR
jgi:protoheme IX farnesyltransferase